MRNNREPSFSSEFTNNVWDTVTFSSLTVLATSMYAKVTFELNEVLNLYFTYAIIGSASALGASALKYMHDYRKTNDNYEDGQDDDNDDGWPGDDGPPDIDPTGGGGLRLDWTQEAEEYANSKPLVDA